MHELILKGRRFHEAGSDAYGNVLLLQVSRITSHLHLANRDKALLPSLDLFEPSERATLQDYNELGFSACRTGHGQTYERRGRRDFEGRDYIPSFNKRSEVRVGS